jgi:hypothetical protein
MKFPSEEFVRAFEVVIAKHPNRAMHSVEDVRAECTLSKSTFDSTAFALLYANVIGLYEHDFASSLTPERLSMLVRSPDGKRYFNGISLAK